MIEDQFIELIEPLLQQAGSSFQGGEEFRQPPLDVLRYYRRPVRIGRIPLLGQAQSVVLVARQPVDIDGSRPSYERLLTRLAMAVNGRFPPWKGLTIGLNAVVLTPEPIAPATTTCCAKCSVSSFEECASSRWASIESTSARKQWRWRCTPTPAARSPKVGSWPSSSANGFAVSFR